MYFIQGPLWNLHRRIEISLLLSYCWVVWSYPLVFINTLRPRQNGRHSADDTFNAFFQWKFSISINIAQRFFASPIKNMPTLVQIVAWGEQATSHHLHQWWRRLLTHIYVARPQWVSSDQLIETCDAQLCLYIRPPLFRITARPQFNFKPLSEAMMIYCQLCPCGRISVKS